jgi:hypothetical protein
MSDAVTVVYYVPGNFGEDGEWLATLTEAREAANGYLRGEDGPAEIQRHTIPGRVARELACRLLNGRGFSLKSETVK